MANYLDKAGLELYNSLIKTYINSQAASAVYDDTELRGKVTANTTAIETLNGTGAGSVTKTVADAIAEIVADAPESLDTLKEISDWISSHESSAAAMNTAIGTNTTNITALTNLVGTLPEGITSTTVVAYIGEAINKALETSDLSQYAKASDLTAATARITANETAIASINNETTGILKQAKDYADGLATNYDAAGTAETKASAALADAKTYADGLNTAMTTKVEGVEAKIDAFTAITTDEINALFTPVTE